MIVSAKIATAQGIVNGGSLATSAAHKTEGKDAKITLNGVVYEGSSNTFEINGLTITALQKSDEEVTLSTRQDTDGIFDMIKNFFIILQRHRDKGTTKIRNKQYLKRGKN